MGAAPSPAIPLGQLTRLLRRHVPLILLLALVGAVGAYAYARTLPKSYTASSLIAVEGDRLAIPELQGALRSEAGPDPLPFVRTEMQALTARDLVQDVVQRLRLVELPEFNAALRPPGLVQQLKEAMQAWMPHATDKPLDGPEEGVLQAASRATKVFQDNRSLAIEVSFTSEDPKLAAGFVNALVSEYIRIRSERRASANQGANTALTERIDQVRRDLADIEQKIRELRSGSELVQLRAGSVGQQQVEELATALSRASLERAQLETTFERATALSRQGASDALASVLNSATISQLRAQEARASQRVAEMSSRYGSNYPAVGSAQAELDSVRRQVGGEVQRIVTSLGTQLRVAREHEADVRRRLEAARLDAVKAENARAQLDQLAQEAATRRNLYQTLLERAQQTTSQPSVAQAPDVRVLGTAAPPGSPSGPNMKIAFGLGGVAGGLLGCAAALARRRTAPASTAASASGLNVVATVPAAFLGRGRASLPARVAAAPDGPEARTLRGLRTTMRHLGRTRIPRVVVFAPASPAGVEGGHAAQLACALARVAATDGERVLLVDANLAAPSAPGLLGSVGGDLLAVLGGAEDWREAAATDARTALEVLAAAQPAPAAPGLLAGIAFQNLLVEAGGELDFVVLIAPLAASDEAFLLAQRSDLAVAVLDARIAQDTAEAAAERLGRASRCPAAAVLVGG